MEINNKIDRSLIISFLGMSSLLILQSFSGTVIFLFLIFLIPLSIYSLIVMFKGKKQRQIRSIKLLLWFLAVIFSFCYNFYINESIRMEAKNIVTKIENYKLDKNKFPENLKQIEVLSKDIKNKIILIFYFDEKNQVHLSYLDTYTQIYTYNFKE